MYLKKKNFYHNLHQMDKQNKTIGLGNTWAFIGHLQGDDDLKEGVICETKYTPGKHSQRFCEMITYFGISEDRIIESMQSGEPVNKEGLIIVEYNPITI
jgi:hypothetical protein